ncbi:Putative F-box protein At2g39415 [Linum grandiflorum]
MLPTTVDRISELPDEIIHRILGGLDTHESAARTCILSSRWLHLWNSYPVVKFQDNGTLDYFQRFAIATTKKLRLLHERAVPLLLDSFDITLKHLDKYQALTLDQLLSIGVDGGCSGSSPIKVAVKNRDDFRVSINGAIFSNLRRTKFLHLDGCDLTKFNTRLDNLQTLRLEGVQVSGESFPSCLANAPLLENLILRHVRGMRSLDISASNFPSLKSLSLSGIMEWQVHLQLTSTPLLQTLAVAGNVSCKFLAVAPNVKSVELSLLLPFTGGELDDFVSKLPSLESFYLEFQRELSRGMRISARHLRELTLKMFEEGPTTAFEIDAPNLVSLSIRTGKLLPVLNIVNVASNCRCTVHCSTYRLRLTTDWFVRFRKCLTTLAARIHHLVFLVVFTKLTEYISEQIESRTLLECCSNEICWRHRFKDIKKTSIIVEDLQTVDKSSDPPIKMLFLFM